MAPPNFADVATYDLLLFEDLPYYIIKVPVNEHMLDRTYHLLMAMLVLFGLVAFMALRPSSTFLYDQETADDNKGLT